MFLGVPSSRLNAWASARTWLTFVRAEIVNFHSFDFCHSKSTLQKPMELRSNVIYSLDLKSLKSHMVDMQIVFSLQLHNAVLNCYWVQQHRSNILNVTTSFILRRRLDVTPPPPVYNMARLKVPRSSTEPQPCPYIYIIYIYHISYIIYHIHMYIYSMYIFIYIYM